MTDEELTEQQKDREYAHARRIVLESAQEWAVSPATAAVLLLVQCAKRLRALEDKLGGEDDIIILGKISDLPEGEE